MQFTVGGTLTVQGAQVHETHRITNQREQPPAAHPRQFLGIRPPGVLILQRQVLHERNLASTGKRRAYPMSRPRSSEYFHFQLKPALFPLTGHAADAQQPPVLPVRKRKLERTRHPLIFKQMPIARQPRARHFKRLVRYLHAHRKHPTHRAHHRLCIVNSKKLLNLVNNHRSARRLYRTADTPHQQFLQLLRHAQNIELGHPGHFHHPDFRSLHNSPSADTSPTPEPAMFRW